MIAEKMSMEAMAAMDFEPWDEKGNGSPEYIYKNAPKHLRNASAAFYVLCMSKGQLVEFAHKEPESFMNIQGCISDSGEAFQMLGSMLEGAQLRMLCAGAVLVSDA